MEVDKYYKKLNQGFMDLKETRSAIEKLNVKGIDTLPSDKIIKDLEWQIQRAFELFDSYKEDITCQ